MSLGLFNCRLIQPAGDQLFFLSAVLPHRCQFGQALFSLLVTRPARPRPTGGRRMLLVFPSQKALVLVFGGGEVPSDAEGFTFTPTDSPANFPEDPDRKSTRLNYSHSLRGALPICLSFSESSCFGFRRGRSPVGCRRVHVHSHRFTREFPRRSPIPPTDSAIEPEIQLLGGGRSALARGSVAYPA